MLGPPAEAVLGDRGVEAPGRGAVQPPSRGAVAAGDGAEAAVEDDQRPGRAVLRGIVHGELDRLLVGTYTDPDNARLAKLSRKHRDSVLRFLDHDKIDATNNLAQRERRSAELARKLSVGNQTEEGSETHAMLASEFRTYRSRAATSLSRWSRCSATARVVSWNLTTWIRRYRSDENGRLST